MNLQGKFGRQGFLGGRAESILRSVKAGVVGAGGGGSHIVQQLLHLGFKNIVNFDPDKVEVSNLNRMVGATMNDVGTLKVEVMKRLAYGLSPDADFQAVSNRWQDFADLLHSCDIVFGCVDGFSERQQLEIATRRYLVPYIDIGLDVYSEKGEPPQMAGQVILSMPGFSCMNCLAFLTNEKLEQEGLAYGLAGPRPQVVWANGVLASTAVGLAVDLLTDWTSTLRDSVFLLYHGNSGTVRPHPKWQFRRKDCPHFTATIGPAKLTKI